MTKRKPGLILIVEDNELNRDLLGRHLQREGHTPAVAENGRQAWAMLMARKFDLILLDIMMPDMNGYQLLEKLKGDEDFRHIPVIIISALEDMESVTRCIELGAEDYLPKPFNAVLLKARLSASLEKKFLRDREQAAWQQIAKEKERAEELLQLVIPLGVALSAEKDFDRLLEMILLDAKLLCNADGGTLYLRTADPNNPGAGDRLRFEIMRTDSLNIALGGTTGQKITFEPLRLYEAATGAANHNNVATHAALTAESINIPDAYEAEGFDFSGTRSFDQANGYRSKSFLTIPLKNHANQVIGILQLINARDQKSGEVIAFDRTLQHLVESLSALATVALEAYIREQRLEAQLQELRILVDEARKSTQVSEITETEYFRTLLEKVQVLRRKAQQGQGPR